MAIWCFQVHDDLRPGDNVGMLPVDGYGPVGIHTPAAFIAVPSGDLSAHTGQKIRLTAEISVDNITFVPAILLPPFAGSSFTVGGSTDRGVLIDLAKSLREHPSRPAKQDRQLWFRLMATRTDIPAATPTQVGSVLNIAAKLSGPFFQLGTILNRSDGAGPTAVIEFQEDPAGQYPIDVYPSSGERPAFMRSSPASSIEIGSDLDYSNNDTGAAYVSLLGPTNGSSMLWYTTTIQNIPVGVETMYLRLGDRFYNYGPNHVFEGGYFQHSQDVIGVAVEGGYGTNADKRPIIAAADAFHWTMADSVSYGYNPGEPAVGLRITLDLLNDSYLQSQEYTSSVKGRRTYDAIVSNPYDASWQSLSLLKGLTPVPGSSNEYFCVIESGVPSDTNPSDLNYSAYFQITVDSAGTVPVLRELGYALAFDIEPLELIDLAASTVTANAFSFNAVTNKPVQSFRLTIFDLDDVWYLLDSDGTLSPGGSAPGGGLLFSGSTMIDSLPGHGDLPLPNGDYYARITLTTATLESVTDDVHFSTSRPDPEDPEAPDPTFIEHLVAYQITDGSSHYIDQQMTTPSLRVNFTLATLSGADEWVVQPQVSLNGSSWYPALMLGSWGSPTAASGPSTRIIDLNQTFTTHWLDKASAANLQIRLEAVPIGATMAPQTSSPLAVPCSLTPPQNVSVDGPAIVGESGQWPFAVTADAGGNAPARVSVGIVEGATIVDVMVREPLVGGEATYQFGDLAAHPDGDYSLAVVVQDQYWNTASIIQESVTLLRNIEENLDAAIRIIGSVGNSDYTGIAIAPDGTFAVDRSATVRLTAPTGGSISYQVVSSSYCESTYAADGIDREVGDWVTLTAATAEPVIQLTSQPASSTEHDPATDNFDVSSQVPVTVRFRDAAGSTIDRTAYIVLNTRLYQTAHRPLRPRSGEYQPLVLEVDSSGDVHHLPETTLLSHDPIRAWGDIFYPTTHGYPVDVDGKLDVDAALAITEPTPAYDPVVNESGQIAYDEQGRPVTVAWTRDGTKNYGSMLSSTVDRMIYWVIDNVGWGDIELEFEHFDVDANIYGPPYNPLAAYDCDALVIYDASADGALSLDTEGNWTLTESPTSSTSKLVELAAYTGRGGHVIDLTSGSRVNAGQHGQFVSPTFHNTSRLVMMMSSDAHQTASGFKLKAGPSHDNLWRNWDLDAANGWLWVHQWVGIGDVNGLAGEQTKRMVYDWLDGDVDIDVETGTVTFASPPGGVVTADYSYYADVPVDQSLYIASDDDFVDYQDAPVYLAADGEGGLTAETRALVYGHGGAAAGRLTGGCSWDKDRGVLEITDSTIDVSDVRLFADHHHHTYKRLSNDGRGDLTFADPVLVADETPIYPEYSFADVKFVNEGDALLEDWRVQVTMRGYDTDGKTSSDYRGEEAGGGWAVDQVLDLDRPWDVQKGTPDETFERMRMVLAEDFVWETTLTAGEAQTLYGQGSNDAIAQDDLGPRGTQYGRLIWHLGNGGTNWPNETSAGEKRCGLEIDGKYYILTV